MFFWCMGALLLSDDTAKDLFKWWVLSPISMPLTVIIKFINW